jgi:hypothetical protein
MAAYTQLHDIRGLMDELAQSILVHMPDDPRKFLAAELGRHHQQPTGDREDVGKMLEDSFVLSLHASAGHGCEGAGEQKAIRIQRILRKTPSGRMARYQAERELAEKIHAVLWGRNAGFGEHRAEPQAETSASLQDQAGAPHSKSLHDEVREELI